MTYDKETWRASVKNGEIPRDKLAEIDPEQFDPDLNGPALMHPEAAVAMGTLLRQAWEDGATSLRVKYSYRTIAKQWEKWEDFQNGGNLAAFPGTSNHGWAVSVDFTGLGSHELTWLKNNAARYGFVNDVPSENWHYTYQEHTWDGDDMTKEERAQLNRWVRFVAKLDEQIDGDNTVESLARQTAAAIKAKHTEHVAPGDHTHPHVHGEAIPTETP